MDELQTLNRDTYVVWVVRTSWENLPHVLWGALLFSLCAVPAFVLFALGWLAPMLVIGALTIAPAWTALLAYEHSLFTGQSLEQGSFLGALQYYWRRSALLGALAAFPLLATLLTLPSLRQEPVPQVVWIGLGADFLGMALMAVLLLYAFPLLIYHDQSVRVVLRDGLILAGRHPVHTVGLLGMGILFGFALSYLSLGLLFILPALYGMFVVGNALLVLQLAHA